jgi:hypothetical protein
MPVDTELQAREEEAGFYRSGPMLDQLKAKVHGLRAGSYIGERTRGTISGIQGLPNVEYKAHKNRTGDPYGEQGRSIRSGAP